MSWFGMSRYPESRDEEIDAYYAKERRNRPSDPIRSLLDALSECVSSQNRPDRMGSYTETVLDRRKARRVIKKWLAENSPL